MAASTADTHTSNHDGKWHKVAGNWKKLSDAVFEVHGPAKPDIELVFFHGFPQLECDDAHVRTWLKDDDSECWLDTLLVKTFADAKVRILSIHYGDDITKSGYTGQMDTYNLAETLARSIIGFAGVGQRCPAVFVGHDVGGLVLKEVCLMAEKLETLGTGKPAVNVYFTFLQNFKGAFFYATPHSGSRVKARSDQGGPFLPYLDQDDTHNCRINSDFQKLRDLYGWRTGGVCESQGTKASKPGRKVIASIYHRGVQKEVCNVDETSARNDTDVFACLAGADHYSICKPKDETCDRLLFLVTFLREILDEERRNRKKFQLLLGAGPGELLDTPDRIYEVVDKLQLHNTESVMRLALVGMGGIGKTTLAKQVLVKIRSQFDFYCFIERANGETKKKDIRSSITHHLFKRNGEEARLRDDKGEWPSDLYRRKLLIILDNGDAEAEKHLNRIWRERCCGEGSRLIMTSRNHRREGNEGSTVLEVVHEVLPLSKEQSKQLFMDHMGGGILDKIPATLVQRIVSTCSGLPLTLKVMGSYLGQESNEAIWEEAHARLKGAEALEGVTDDAIWSKLRISYDRLAEGEKTMFLELAVFDLHNVKMIQYDLNVFKAAWKARKMSPESGLRNLEKRSLIRLVENSSEGHTGEWKTIKVASIHEQLRDMARSICRPKATPVENCRGVWDPNDVEDLFSKCEGCADTEMLSIALNQTEQSSAPEVDVTRGRLKPNSKVQFRILHFLRMSHTKKINYHGLPSLGFSSKLVMLHMIGCSGWRENMLNLQESTLRSSSPESMIESSLTCWPIRKEDVGNLDQLAVLLLDECTSVSLPENFHELKNLKILHIHVIDDLLRELPEKFGFLQSLQQLSIRSAGLEELPSSLLELTSLRTLSIENCKALKNWLIAEPSLTVLSECNKMSHSLLHSLTSVTLTDLPSLESLPNSFGNLRALERLYVSRCSALKSLPESFGELHNLKVLHIIASESLDMLCKSFGGLSQCEDIELAFLPNLALLPDTFGKLSSLANLKLQECPALKRLPESFGELQELKWLSIISCHGLISLSRNFSQLCEKLSLLHLVDLPNLNPCPEYNTATVDTRMRTKSTQDLPVHVTASSTVGEEIEHLRFRKLLNIPLETSDRVRAIIHGLQLQSTSKKPLSLALVGMAGVGKTFLAKQVLMEIRHQFDFVFFAENWYNRELKSLGPRHVLERICFPGKGRKTLVMIDNVPDGDLEAISSQWESDWFGAGSRLITIHRSPSMLTGTVIHQVPPLSPLESQEMFETRMDDSVSQTIPDDLVKKIVSLCDSSPLLLQIFGSCLRKGGDTATWNDIHCKLGSAHSPDANIHERISRKLKVGFDLLGPLEQTIFLDLAVFDIDVTSGYDLNMLKNVWDTGATEESPDLGLQKLEEASFISLSKKCSTSRSEWDGGNSKGKIKLVASINQFLRDMGKSINRPPDVPAELCRGIWDFHDAKNLLEDIEGEAGKVEILSICAVEQRDLSCPYNRAGSSRTSTCHIHDHDELLPLTLKWESFVKLKNLRLLRMGGATMMEAGSSSRFPSTLAMLHMIDCSRDPSFVKPQWMLGSGWPIRKEDVSFLHQISIVILDNCSSVSLPSNFHELRKLKVLRIHVNDKSLRIVPKNFGLLPALEELSIQGAGFRELPNSMQAIMGTHLKTLELIACSEFRGWPAFHNITTAPVQSRAITQLRLHNLNSIEEFPESFGLMTSLEYLSVDRLNHLVTLPNSLGNLRELKQLLVVNCERFEELPESLGFLSQLEELELRILPQLGTLPERLGELVSLDRFVLEDSSFESFPQSVGNLRSLRTLCLRRLPNLVLLPDSFGGLTSLEGLDLEILPRLSLLPTTFGELASLRVLHVTGCSSLRNLPDSFGQLQALRHLSIRACPALQSLGATSRQLALSYLELDNELLFPGVVVNSGKRPFSATLLPDLATSEIPSIEHPFQPYLILEEIAQVRKLDMLTVRGFHHVTTFPSSVGKLRDLRSLSIASSDGFEELEESLGQLAHLTSLIITSCRRLKSLPKSLGCMTMLTVLSISDCAVFDSLPESIEELCNLRELTVRNCGEFKGLPEHLVEIKGLEKLTVIGCTSFRDLPKSFRRENVWELRLADNFKDP